MDYWNIFKLWKTELVKNNEGSILIESAFVLPFVTMCFVMLLVLMVRVENNGFKELREELYVQSTIDNQDMSNEQLLAIVKTETDGEISIKKQGEFLRHRIRSFQYFIDCMDEIAISQTIKSKYYKYSKLILDILEVY